MPEITTNEIREYLKKIQGREITLDKLRSEFNILSGTKSFDAVRNIMFQLAEQKIVKFSGKRDGVYKVLQQVQPVIVFSSPRERKPPFDLKFPRDFDTGVEFGFAENVVIREGDCILIAGVSNYGKTALAMNFLAENINQRPVLMGNEYTKDDEPTPRFLNRLDALDSVKWTDDSGNDLFTLLPVYSDYAEYVVKDRINIIDWINIDTGEHYLIGSIMEGIKRAGGKGITIIVIQKSESSDSGRGGQFTKDFADLELIIDRHTDYESRLTIGKVKEWNGKVIGRSWAFEISKGVKLKNLREIIKCLDCYGKGWQKWGNSTKPCERCNKIGWIDK